MPIESVEHIGLEEMRRRTPSPNVLVISILDKTERDTHKAPNLAGYQGVLSLTFEDASEESRGMPSGHWPDEPSIDDHRKWASRKGQVPSTSHARSIAEFVEDHESREDSFHLIVHCFQGVSRSAAVALWVHQTTNAALLNNSSNSNKNPRLYKLLNGLSEKARKSALASKTRP